MAVCFTAWGVQQSTLLTIQRRNNLRMTVGLLTVLPAQIQLKLQNTTTKHGGQFAETSAAQCEVLPSSERSNGRSVNSLLAAGKSVEP
jgi:hypothetical protein